MEGSTEIANASMALKMLTMSEDEKQKMEMIKKNQEMFKAKQKEEAEYKKQLEHISQQERKVKQAEKNETTKGNKLKYGANIVKFEPPPEKRGGWWAARIDNKLISIKTADRNLWWLIRNFLNVFSILASAPPYLGKSLAFNKHPILACPFLRTESAKKAFLLKTQLWSWLGMD